MQYLPLKSQSNALWSGWDSIPGSTVGLCGPVKPQFTLLRLLRCSKTPPRAKSKRFGPTFSSSTWERRSTKDLEERGIEPRASRMSKPMFW